MTLHYKNNDYVLDNLILEFDMKTTTPEEIAANAKHVDNTTKVSCIMISIMAPDLQNYYEDY